MTCVAVDRAGNLLVGLRPRTAAQIRRALLKQLVPKGARIPSTAPPRRVLILVRRSGARTTGHLVAGRLARKATELGRLSKSFSKAGKRKLKIKLTRRGKRALKGAQHLRVRETMSFTPRGNASVAARTTFTIRP